MNFSGGTTGITYSSQAAVWSRVGNMVTLNMRITLTSKGTDTGNASITFSSLPASATIDAALSVRAINLNFTDNIQAILVSSTIFIQQINSATGVNGACNDTNFANNTTLNITGSYLAA